MRSSAIAMAAAALFVVGAAAFFVFSGSGSRIVSTVRIHREIGDVFEFFTTPKNWPQWHPASISVARATDHSLAVGEEVGEEFRVGSGKAHAVWRVTASEAPHLWQIENAPTEDARVTITYRLHTDGRDTVFERDMQYQFNRLRLRVFDPIFIRRHMERESQQALTNAKDILER